MVFWIKTSVGNATGDDERFVNRKYYIRDFLWILFFILGIVEHRKDVESQTDTDRKHLRRDYGMGEWI